VDNVPSLLFWTVVLSMKLKLIGRWLLTISGAMKRMKKTCHSLMKTKILMKRTIMLMMNRTLKKTTCWYPVP